MLVVKLVCFGMGATVIAGHGKAGHALGRLAELTAPSGSTNPDEYKRLAQDLYKSDEYKDFMKQSAAEVSSNPHTLLNDVKNAAPQVIEAANNNIVTSDDVEDSAGGVNLRTVASGGAAQDALASTQVEVCLATDQKGALVVVASTLDTISGLIKTMQNAKDDYDAGNYRDAIVLLDNGVSPILAQLTNLAMTKLPHSGAIGRWRDALVKINNLVLQYVQSPPGVDSWVGFKHQIIGLLTELLIFPQMVNSQLLEKHNTPRPDATNQELRAMVIQESLSVGCTCGSNIFSAIFRSRTTTTVAPSTSSSANVAAPTVTDVLDQSVALVLFIESTTKSLANLVKDIRTCKKDKASWENLEYRILLQILQMIDEAAQNHQFEHIYLILKANSHNLTTYLLNVAAGTSIDDMEQAVINFIGAIQTQLQASCPNV